MRRLLATALALALVAACSDSPCQDLGERLCSCTGASSDSCTAQVEDQLKAAPMNEDACEAYLGSCSAPPGGDLCEWLLTPEGKRACGLSP